MANPAVILKAEILGNAAGLIGAIDGANKAVDGFTRDTVEKFAGMSAQIGLAFAGFGAAITGSLGLAAKSSQEITNALGDMSSVGFKDLEGMRKAALDFSSAWSGTTAPDFVKSAYDIKSAIATLSDEGVIAVTRFSAITAKATKASADEMSRAFTTAYGIFKPMTKDMADAEWADRFSGIMAATAEKFRTTGSQMSDALKNLGATGAAAGISMQEQFAVLGQLQDVMPGAEAGTQYKAFLLNIGKGAEELGINVTDASGRLKSLPDILTAIQKKFPDLTNAAAQMKLKEAMGSEEAYRFILQMATGAERLSGNIKGLSGAWTEGSAGAVRMAEAMNVDPYVLLTQQISVLMAEIGLLAANVFAPFVKMVSDLVLGLRTWINENKELSQVLVYVTAFVGGLSIALGVATGIAAGAAFAYLAISGALAGIAAQGGVIAIIKGLSAAFLLPLAPIALVIAKIALLVAAVSGVAYAIYYWWGPISRFASDLWNGIVLGFQTAIKFMADLLPRFWNWFKQTANDGWNFLKESAQGAVDYVRGILEGLGDKIKSVWQSIKNLARDTASTLTFGLVQASGPAAANIPQAANGGLLTGPKSGYLAMLHGTELVVPERMLPAISNSTMNQSSMVFNITQSDGESTEALANRIAEIWNRRRR
jgi:TP901 family phage tail tape measure protein